jgi:hypothetical protein
VIIGLAHVAGSCFALAYCAWYDGVKDWAIFYAVLWAVLMALIVIGAR